MNVTWRKRINVIPGKSKLQWLEWSCLCFSDSDEQFLPVNKCHFHVRLESPQSLEMKKKKNPASSSCCHKPPPAATVKQDKLICIQNSDNKLPLPFVINHFRRVKIWCKFILVSSYYFWKPCCCFSTNPSPTSASIHLRTQPRWWTKMQQQQRLVTSDPVEDQS